MSVKMHSVFLSGALAIAGLTASVAHAGNYDRPNMPANGYALMPLPPGAVKPQGWLRDWCMSARDGLVGHLDESPDPRASVFRDGWYKDASTAGSLDWQMEQSAYWTDALIRLGHALQDTFMLNKALRRLDFVASRIRDGKPFSWWEPSWSNMKGDLPMWANNMLARAFLAQYQATGDKKYFDALNRAYTNYSPPGWIATSSGRWGTNLESILETFSLGADSSLLKYSTTLYNKELSVYTKWAAMQAGMAPDHGVTFNEVSKMPCQYFPWSGKDTYLTASVNRYKYAEDYHMQPHGCITANEPMMGINCMQGSETCNISDYIWSHTFLLRFTGDRLYADRMERAFFNAGPGCITRDWKQIVYVQVPNRYSTSQPTVGGWNGQSYEPMHSPQCCIGNVGRFLANYVLHLWMATPDNGLALALNGPCTVNATVGSGVPIEITCQTNYPFDDRISLTVTTSAAVQFPLYIRVPFWCTRPQLTVNGQNAAAIVTEKGFLKTERVWSTGDKVTIVLPMKPRVVTGKERSADGAPGSPFSCVLYGPLLMALALPEKGPNEAGTGADWSYALDYDSAKGESQFTVEKKAMPDKWNWPLEAPLVVTAPGTKYSWSGNLLPGQAVTGSAARPVRMVPYGCTYFRICMFPMTDKTAKTAASISMRDPVQPAIILVAPASVRPAGFRSGATAGAPVKARVCDLRGRIVTDGTEFRAHRARASGALPATVQLAGMRGTSRVRTMSPVQ